MLTIPPTTKLRTTHIIREFHTHELTEAMTELATYDDEDHRALLAFVRSVLDPDADLDTTDG